MSRCHEEQNLAFWVGSDWVMLYIFRIPNPWDFRNHKLESWTFASWREMKEILQNQKNFERSYFCLCWSIFKCDTNFPLRIQFPVDLNRFQTRKIKTGKNPDFPGFLKPDFSRGRKRTNVLLTSPDYTCSGNSKTVKHAPVTPKKLESVRGSPCRHNHKKNWVCKLG